MDDQQTTHCPKCGAKEHLARSKPENRVWLCRNSSMNENIGRKQPGKCLFGMWKLRAEESEKELNAVMEALMPSAATKGAYIGEFDCNPSLGACGGAVSWVVIKEIMAAIRARANETYEGSGR